MSYSNPVGGAGPVSTPFATPVAGTKLRIKRSAVLNKVPTATDTEFGELIVNYNAGSAALYTRGSDDSLQQIGGVYISNSAPASPAEKQWWWDATNQVLKLRSVGTWIEVSKPFDITAASIGDLSDVDLSGINDGDLLQWNGSEFVSVTPSSISVDVDLGYTPAAGQGTVTNTAGNDAVIPLANGTNAGLSLNNYTTAEKDKLAGIEDGAEANVGTDLGYTPAADKGTVTSTTGADADIPLANGTTAGLSLNNFSATDKDKLDAYPDDPGNLPAPATPNLQAVTDAGSTTTNGATFSDGNITLNADGSCSFANGEITFTTIGRATFGEDVYAQRFWAFGPEWLFGNNITNATAATTNLLRAFNQSTSRNTVIIKGDGSAIFSDSNITFSADGTIQAENLTDGITTKTMTEVLAGGGGTTGDLQAVTDEGNTTTNSIVINDNITLNANGSAEFAGDVTLSGTGFIKVPEGTNAERPASPAAGMIRFTSDDNIYEGYNGTEWVQLLDNTAVGTDPNEIPTNQLLGQMAFIDHVATLRPSSDMGVQPVNNGEVIMALSADGTSLVFKSKPMDGSAVKTATITLS